MIHYFNESGGKRICKSSAPPGRITFFKRNVTCPECLAILGLPSPTQAELNG